jgi:hypothetical protein
MKFNITELHNTRLKLENQLKSLKVELAKPHVLPESATCQSMKCYLRTKVTFVYTAIAHSRNKIHATCFKSLDEQNNWLTHIISESRNQEAWANMFAHPNKGFEHFFVIENQQQAA